jgi:hypothetical protein
VLVVLGQTGFISTKSSQTIWEMVALDSQRRNKFLSSNDSLLYSKSNLDNLRSIVDTTQKLIRSQELLRKIVTVQAHIRGHLARKRYAQLRKDYIEGPLRLRNVHFRELLRKEEAYNFALDVMVSQFLIPARDASKSLHFRKIIPLSEVDAIFGNIEEIQKVHNEFYNELKKVEENWPDISGVADAFHFDSFKCYGKYVNNFQFAYDSLEKSLVKYEGFAQLCRETFERVDMEIQSLVSSPLNQISTYVLMLERILENTPSNRREAKKIEQCLSAVRETNAFILGELENAENQASILTVEKKIARKIKLLKPQRLFVTSCVVEFVNRAMPNKRNPGELFLFSDIILIGKAHPKVLTVKATYNLESTTLNLPEDLKKQNAAELVFSDGVRFVIYFSSTDFRSVTGMIKDYIIKNQKNRVFEVSLKQLLINDGNPDPPIPNILRTIITYLDEKALKSEGLFRIAGSRKGMDDLREAIDKNGSVDFGGSDNIHTVASLLKFFFRCLPEPLLTYDSYAPLIQSSEEFSLNDNLRAFQKRIREVLDVIPYENRVVAKYLVDFLGRVAAHSEVNMMLPSNLAICFAPNLLRPREHSINAALDVMKVNTIIEIIILEPQLISLKKE